MFYIPDSNSPQYKIIFDQLPPDDQKKKIYMFLNTEWTADELMRWPIKIDRNASWVSIYMIADRTISITPSDMTILLYIFETSYDLPTEYETLVFGPNTDYVNGFFTFRMSAGHAYASEAAAPSHLTKSEESYTVEPTWIKVPAGGIVVLPWSQFYKIYIKGFITSESELTFSCGSNQHLYKLDHIHLTALSILLFKPYLKITPGFELHDDIILETTITVWIKPTYNGIFSVPITVDNCEQNFSKIYIFDKQTCRYNKLLTEAAASLCVIKLKELVALDVYAIGVV